MAASRSRTPRARANPLVLLPNHPSPTIVRIGKASTYGYYVVESFDDAMATWWDAREADAIAVFNVASSEGVKVACHHSEIVSIIDCRTRT